MVVMDPVEPTMFAHSWPIAMPDSAIRCSRADVMSAISGPVLKLTSIDRQYIDTACIVTLLNPQIELAEKK
jgi:hypothetical protein